MLSGDVPLIRPETIARVRDFHLSKKAAMTILTAVPPDPFGYGRVIRAGAGSDRVKAIVEQKALDQSAAEMRARSTPAFTLLPPGLSSPISTASPQQMPTRVLPYGHGCSAGESKATVVALKAADPAEVLGANTLAELASLDATLRMRKCDDLMAAGVSIYRPETCVIDPDVEIGADTILEPFVQILGRTRIGSDCRIRSFSIISDSQIADNVLIRPGCIIDQSRLPPGR